MKKSESIKELAAALSKSQGEFPQIRKSRTAKIPMKAGGYYQFKYADLAEIFEAVLPTLSKNGLALSQNTEMRTEGLLLETMLMHSSGEWISSDYPLKLHEKAQEMGGEITYARRYTVTAVLGVQADDYDSDSISQNAGKEDLLEKAKTRVAETKKAAAPKPKPLVNHAPGAENPPPIDDIPFPEEEFTSSEQAQDRYFPPSGPLPSPNADFKTWKIPFGKFYGKNLSEIGVLQGGKYLEWLIDDARKKEQPMNSQALQFQAMYHQYAQSELNK